MYKQICKCEKHTQNFSDAETLHAFLLILLFVVNIFVLVKYLCIMTVTTGVSINIYTTKFGFVNQCRKFKAFSNNEEVFTDISTIIVVHTI